jgi:hypothetical protein
MPNTYKALLKGDRLEWVEEPPQELRSGQPLTVSVSVVQQPSDSPKARGRRMAEALEKLAEINALPDIPHPEAWERETREDRPLPGRDR